MRQYSPQHLVPVNRSKIDRIVDRYLRTSVPVIFAAGGVTRWPDPHTGQQICVEHLGAAERQGQTEALKMIGGNEPFDAVRLFWSATICSESLVSA